MTSPTIEKLLPLPNTTISNYCKLLMSFFNDLLELEKERVEITYRNLENLFLMSIVLILNSYYRAN